VTGFETIDQRLRTSLDQPRFYTLMAAVCALMAVSFVALGIYAMVAWAVVRRTPEFGIRMALGADQGAIVRTALREGIGTVAVGVGAGLVLSMAVAEGPRVRGSEGPAG
jgi:ABC-type antimicrobial peptide transport system permease subunit